VCVLLAVGDCVAQPEEPGQQVVIARGLQPGVAGSAEGPREHGQSNAAPEEGNEEKRHTRPVSGFNEMLHCVDCRKPCNMIRVG